MIGLKWVVPVVIGLVFIGIGGFLGVAHLEENDAFCASCHSEPEATFYQRTQAAKPVDLASVHALLSQNHTGAASTRCIDCHAGPGVAGRANAMRLGASDAVKWVSGSAIQPAVQTTPLADANCLKCHAAVPTAGNFDNHMHRYLARWQGQTAGAAQRAATCATCHTSHTTDGNAAIGFLNQQKTQEQCKRCHVALGVVN